MARWQLIRLSTMFCLASALVFGQSQNATLAGTVTDKSGGVIPNATATVSASELQSNIVVHTDVDGRFAFPNLAPGTYTLTVTATGFSTSVHNDILLVANQSARVDASLDVGDTSTKVEVQAQAAQLNYDNGAQQEGVPPQIIRQLPLLVSAGTPPNAVQFLTFLPGVNTGTSPSAFNSRINGGLKMGDEAVMDGVSMQEGTMSQSGMVSFFDFPTTPDMVSEVQVLTSSYEPQYGTTTGGEIIVTTRSGTDQFHGSMFEYFRNKSLNALQFTNNRGSGDQRPKDNENEFGGSIGGPVKLPFLPFIWGAKHKTYFFHDEEYLRSLGGTSRPLVSIPSMLNRTGDFSDLGIPIYDPTTETINNGVIQRTQFPGNKIPTSQLSPLALQWMKYLPTPTAPGPYNNYLGQPVSDGILSNVNHFLYKIDYYLGDKDHFYATVWRQKTDPNNQCLLPVQLCTSSPAIPEDAYVSRLNWDHIFSPTFISHFAYGYVNRNEGYGSVPGQDASVLPKIPNAVAYNASPAANFAAGGLTNLSSWGNTSGPGPLNKSTRPSHIANETITWVNGAHTIKFGGEFRHLAQVFRNNGNQSGTVGFSDLSTGLPGIASGDPFASMIIGAVDNGNLSAYNVAKYGAQQRAYSLFVGDTWKVSQKLTVNYGVRWDRFSPTFETSNQLSFLGFVPNPGAANRIGSVVYAGDSWGAASAGVRYPEEVFNKAFAPRVGFAYQLDDKTVVRAGYGMFYTQAFYPGWGGGMSLDGFNPQLSFGSSLAGYEPSFNLDTGFPAYNRAPDVSLTADNGKNAPQYRPEAANHLPYSQQWNMTVERKIGASSIAGISYVANKGTHYPSQLQPLNVINPSLLSSMGSAELNSVFQPGQTSLYGVSAPYASWANDLNTAGTCKPTVAQALVQYPQYCNGITGLNESEATSLYNSLQLKLEKQFSGGLYLGANYTFSRLTTDGSSTTQATANYGGIGSVISPFQGSRNMSLSPDDITHTFSLMAVYDLPFGKGQKFLNGSRAMDLLVGGWTLASTVKLVSGTPLYFRNSNVCGLPSQIQAACIPGITSASGVLTQGWLGANVNVPMYSSSAFESTSLFAGGNYLGTGPRVSDVRGSPYRDTNLSIAKNFSITERVKIQIRAEAFNIFNNHYFTCDGQAFGDCIPFNNDPSSPSFGNWNGTVSTPRNVQLVGRFTF